MLHFALGILRWPPEAVWRATPREIAAALPPRAAVAVLRRADLAALMTRFPDEPGPPARI